MRVIGIMILLKEWGLFITAMGQFMWVSGRMKKETVLEKRYFLTQLALRENL